jgi:glycine cleavage system H lipoate-binding protein
MSWKIGVPNRGHTTEEAILVQRLNAKGDAVKAGEIVAVAETGKASFDGEALADGLLFSIDAPADTVVTRCGKRKSKQSNIVIDSRRAALDGLQATSRHSEHLSPDACPADTPSLDRAAARPRCTQ